MNQKSSLREVPQLVSWVLTGNSVPLDCIGKLVEVLMRSVFAFGIVAKSRLNANFTAINAGAHR